jgi:S-adenosylmethionine/arginine decarboxylase-like enzyme
MYFEVFGVEVLLIESHIQMRTFCDRNIANIERQLVVSRRGFASERAP